jgi:hypothetical protein
MQALLAEAVPEVRDCRSDLPLAWETLDRLIGEIYECALDPSRWNATIEQIRKAVLQSGWRCARPTGGPPS